MVRLERFERADIPQLLEWINSEKLLRQWGGPGFTYPLDKQQLDGYVMKTEKKSTDTLAYKVIREADGKVIGHISLARINNSHHSARIGRVLVGDPEVRGQGTGEQMMREILRIAFDEMAMHRVSLGVFDFNSPAIACYEKVGFIKEGLLRDTLFVEGEYWSAWEMSMLENEWRDRYSKVMHPAAESGIKE
ncbi:GNAT family N-acetyltransferase [Planococcus lenghuensis]|uniref:GNAT family N-acetyltransferase n=1 Tax=Planococcus lenghuensis TaxID=2213202 RepID=A0A1Q2KUK9_9BACL|nr:GNAT family protein [Planococcus lenghuensis]AQQ51898.1 GNAT family N-acetyltransferase [Planococcus lenghuensis]